MKKYELIYILRTDSDDETKQKIQDKLRGIIEENGEVEVFDVWGNRKLAYEINYIKEGYYIIVNFEAAVEVVAEVERRSRISDAIIRYMVVKQEA